MDDETLSVLSSPVWESVLSEFNFSDESGSVFYESSASSDGEASHLALNPKNDILFNVQSLGWMPVDYKNLRRDSRSSAVNSCIRSLSGQRCHIMDGVGMWGEGMNLTLKLTTNHVKVLDKLTETVLQEDEIKNIKIWGVGRDSKFDFAYVVKDSKTKIFKCYAFQCETYAEIIAKDLHKIWKNFHDKKRLNSYEHKEPEKMISSPEKSSEIFQAEYLGKCLVSNISGINTIKHAIDIVKSQNTKIDVNVEVSMAEIVVKDLKKNNVIVNCRMRYISFIGIGEDIQMFAFISVLNMDGPVCYVFKNPPKSHLPIAVKQACYLRYQSIMESSNAKLS